MSDTFRPSIEHLVQEFLGRKKYRPLKDHELARELGFHGADKVELRRVLKKLEKNGQVVRLRKNRWALPNSGRQTAGIIKIHPKGFAFLVPDDPKADDVYIPGDHLHTALDGDRVMASVIRLPEKKSHRSRNDKLQAPRNEGRILSVLERKTTHLAGILRKTPYYSYLVPDNPKIHMDVRVEKGQSKIDPPEGNKVVVKLKPWEDPRKPLRGELIEDLGEPDAPGVDIKSLLREFQLHEDFSDKVIHQADQLQGKPLDPDQDRKDLRDWLTFTIDPDDAKDFDDAVTLVPLENGWQLGVHIADVSHFVKRDSPIDEEARYRGTSVYLVDRVVTMLPRNLTTDICSLNPNEDRLTHSAVMIIDKKGRIQDVETYPSIIHSNARLTYDQVQSQFDGKEDHNIPAEVLPTLGNLRELAQQLRKRRMKEGSIDMEMPEIRCRLDDQGRAVAFEVRSSKEAYNVIEECMLAANQAVAEKLTKANVPALYRIHEEPDEEQWGQMMEDLLALGVNKVVLCKDHILEMTKHFRNSPIRHAGFLAMLRNFKRAVYASKPGIHFGLGFDLYTHFTSPIRRYPDLLVHRILKAVEKGDPPPYSRDDLFLLAQHCSEMQQKADEAQMLSVETKRIDYYLRQLNKNDRTRYKARIIGLKPKGMLIELESSLQRGLVPYASLNDDYYRVSPDRSRVVGQKHKRKFKTGERLNVELLRVDPARRMIDFRIAEK